MPTLTGAVANPVLGTGATSVGRYSISGGLVHGEFTIIFGSGMSPGNGQWSLALPLPARPFVHSVGHARLRDQSATNLNSSAELVTAGGSETTLAAGGANINVGHNNPWSWTKSDQLIGRFTYEPA